VVWSPMLRFTTLMANLIFATFICMSWYRSGRSVAMGSPRTKTAVCEGNSGYRNFAYFGNLSSIATWHDIASMRA